MKTVLLLCSVHAAVNATDASPDQNPACSARWIGQTEVGPKNAWVAFRQTTLREPCPP